tara:strand:+ start:598 stop:1137 length:540 start_codon:yes stop_codon:yes gene_type:complete
MSQLKVNSIIPVTGVATGQGGGVIQTLKVVKKDTSSWALDTSSNSFKETGVELTITPKKASNIILIWCQGMFSSDRAGEQHYFTFSRSSDSSNFCIGDVSGSRTRITSGMELQAQSRAAQFSCFAIDTDHNTTSANTYKLLATGNNGSGTMYLNRTHSDDNAFFRARGVTTMIIQEIAT